MVKLFEGARLNKMYVLKASVLAIAFWIAQFVYQYFFAEQGLLDAAVVRSFALSGATLISAVLIIGPLARLTKYNFLKHRRTLGVWGFTFVLMHFLAAFYFYFSFQLPLDITVILFGIASMSLFIPAYLTSNDWAVARLGFRKWKFIHRLVYFAYILSVVHYVLLGGNSVPKIALLVVTAVALLLQLAAFSRTVAKTKNKKDVIIGLLIILFGLVMFYLAYSGFFQA